MSELNMLEPCCYHRLLPDFIRKESSVAIFHSGDVLTSHLIDWLSNASNPGSTIYLSVPSISSVTVDAIRQALRKRTYSRAEKKAVPTLSSLVVLTNVPSPSLIKLMGDYKNRLRVGIGSNMSFVASTSLSLIKDGSNVEYGAVMVQGNLLQMITPGSSLLTMTSGVRHFSPYKDYAELCLRHHFISS